MIGHASLTPCRQNVVLAFFLVAMFLNIADRQVVGILAESMRVDLDMTDTQLGLVTGLAFALFNSLVGLPLAYLADRSDRVRLITVATLVWSGATAVCGLAQGFGQLFAARVGLAVGDAAVTPATHSLISDFFAPDRRARAFGIVHVGVPAGVFAAFAIGGFLADTVGWRAAFVVIALPALVLAVVTPLAVPEPRRGLAETEQIAAPPVREQIAQIGRIRPLLWALLGGALANMVLNCIGTWMAVYYIRTFDWSATRTGLTLGALIGIFGTLGVLIGGRVVVGTGRSARIGFIVPAWLLLGAAPLLLLCFLVRDPWWSVALLALPIAAVFGWYAPLYAVIQNLAPVRARALCVAMLAFLNSVVGAGLGPLAIGLLSDLLSMSNQEEPLRYAMLFVPSAALAAGGIFLMGARSSSRSP